MKAFEKALLKKIENSGDLDFQGLKISVFKNGEKLARVEWGKTYPYYDIASLTKVVFTTLWFMERHSKGELSLNTTLSRFLPWYPHKKTKLGELLNHSAGNTWWQPFYKNISKGLGPVGAYQQLEKLCQEAPIEKGAKATYSDIDFFLLGSIMQKIELKPLDKVWEEFYQKHYPKNHFHFNFQNRVQRKKTLYAPTEDCPWRGRILQGEVHDENAWALGGVAPHAGLFAKREDLEAFGLLLRQIARGESRFIQEKSFQTFTSRSLPETKGDWGYGFMLPSSQGSSAGTLFSRKSFGHTGFTGLSFWMDPTRDLFVVLMSNRVHPHRNQKGFVRLRPKIHDWVISELEDRGL